ncbi:MAG: hypothetical protein IT330_17725 [Anaerolineae bacterium]|nr:hypothetical protein [Anaerolineae bacterium]
MKAYLGKIALRYDGERDEVQILLAKPDARPARQVQTRALFDLDQRQRLVRLILNDNKTLRLGLALTHLQTVTIPAKWTWGYVAYDEVARVALIYCGPEEEDGLGRQISRRAVVELDAEGKLLAIRASCRGGEGAGILRGAAAQG